MFSDLIECLNHEISFSTEQEKQFESVKSTPDLSFFQQNQTHKSDIDKTSFLRFLRSVSIIACFDKENIHYEKCKSLIETMNTKNSLKTLISQFKDFQYVAFCETIVALHCYNFATKSDPQYLTDLVKYTVNCEKAYLKPLLYIGILQLVGLKKVWENKNEKVVKLEESALDLITDDCVEMIPILFAQNIDVSCSSTISRILKKYDVFGILLNEWIKPIEELFDREVLDICYDELFYLMGSFLRLYQKSLPTNIIGKRILSLMSKIICHSPQNSQSLIEIFDPISNSHLTNGEYFPAIIGFMSYFTNFEEGTLRVFDFFITHPDVLSKYFSLLNESHSEIISTNISESSADTLRLAKNLCKYLPFNELNRFISCFKTNHLEEPVLTFSSFLFDFLVNNKLGGYAAKTLYYLSTYYPKLLSNFFSDKNLFQTFAEYMNSNSSIASAFSKIARVFLSFSFSNESRFETVPAFVDFIANDYFIDSIYKKYERNSLRWKFLNHLLETSYDYCLCNHSFCSSIQNNPNFVRNLASIVQNTSSILTTPPMETIESTNIRIDNDKLNYVIQFDCTALSFMLHLISFNLNNEKELSYFSKSFFQDNNEASSLFSTFVSFLEVTYPLAANLRIYSIQMLDALCRIANKLHDISVDAFYPHNRQAVLIESIKTNLFKGDIEQTITELDFIANTLSTQLTFAYSFVRQIGSSFLFSASKKLVEISKESPKLLHSISYLLAKMFSQLNHKSPSITLILSNSNFWSSLSTILEMDNNDYDFIAAKASLVQCFILAKQDLSEKIVQKLFCQFVSTIPKPQDKIKINFSLDMQKFINFKLNRKYGEDFYIDCDLLQRYTIDQPSLIENIRKMNVNLSIIDSCTQLLSSLVTLINANPNKLEYIPTIEESTTYILPLLVNDLCPDSSVLIGFELIDLSISKKPKLLYFSNSILKYIQAYITKRPNDYSLYVLSKVFAIFNYQDNKYNEEFYFILESALNVAIKTKSRNAILLSTEIALKLYHLDKWITKSQNILNEINILYHSELGSEILKFLTIVCWNTSNALYLENIGFFEIFNEVPCENDCKSEFWSSIFTFLCSLPNTSHIPFDFISTHFAQISFFLSDDISSEIEPIQRFKVQSQISQLLAHIAKNIEEFSHQNPTIFNALVELISIKIKNCLLFIKENPYISFDEFNIEHLNHNEKTLNLFILHNCLLFVNNTFEFPNGDIHLTILESYTPYPIPDIMDKIGDCVQKLLTNEAKELSHIIIQTFEYSLRIYIGAILKVLHDNTYRNDEKNISQIRKGRDSFSSYITNVLDKIKKLELSIYYSEKNLPYDIAHTEQFLSSVQKYLQRLF